MKKQDILQAFDNLGFSLEEIHKNRYRFKYNDVSYLYTYYDDDEYFMHISIPGIFEVSEENVDMVLPVINRANRIVKYAKLTYEMELVWVAIEYPIFDGIDMEDFIEFAVNLLQEAAEIFNEIISGEYDDNERKEEE